MLTVEATPCETRRPGFRVSPSLAIAILIAQHLGNQLKKPTTPGLFRVRDRCRFCNAPRSRPAATPLAGSLKER